MSQFICCLFLVLASTLSAFARLGETEDQLVARFGDVVKRDTGGNMNLPMLAFEKNGYVIAVFMMDGKCGMEMFKKQDDTEDFSDNEIDLLLQTEAAGQKWTKSDAISTTTAWIRDDGAQGQHDPFAHSFTIISKEYIAASNAAQKATEGQKLNGF